ncbi:penicillin acylase family protein [Algoriphagus sp. AK58]|uniref:penicillin acylase family protein n=1 Tax=Algoriphagus sp. AK58 TaxID=1406877 RepID=UPI001650B5DC|nr:penicillin acylase family protein [Algoriphagus sp. AK58]MBC6365187.1 penicillin acylase family protein [Algoriphagus sp. AK58]
MKKLASILGALLLILVLGVLGFILWQTPSYKGELQLSGLGNEVEVYFDKFGVPHIYAQSEADAYQALGYIHAKERLFQLEMMRRVGSGTLAEFLGPDLLEIDQFFHTLGIPKHAKESNAAFLSQGDTPWKRAADAYVAGVNQFIENGQLPVEYLLLGEKPRPYTLEDMHSIIGYMSFTFAMGLKTDPLVTKMARELGPDYLASLSVQTLPEHHVIPNHYPDSLKTENLLVTSELTALLEKLPVPLLEGSNAWVISGSRTKSGQVLFNNDTHIGFASPSVWFEAHVEYPGFSFYGNHLAGVPFGLVGHTRQHSVGLTMFENDDQDFFEEKLNPSNPNEILIGEQAFPITSRKETIHVKGKDPVEFEVRETVHGPIMNPVVKEIAALTQNPVSSWWVYILEPTKALEALYHINHAETMQQVADAAALIHAPGLNIMYGDKAGNIAWWAAAKLPIRAEKVHSKIFADGSDPESQPKGWYPFTENPQSINPPSGFVASANNQPDTTRSGIFFPGYYYPGERWNRIAKTITSREDWDLESIQSLQLETINEVSVANAKFMISQIDHRQFEDNAQILDDLAIWEGNHALKLSAPTLYYKWLYHTLRLAMEDELGKEGFEAYLQTFMMIRSTRHFLTHEENRWWDNRATDVLESRAEIISEALKISLEELSKQFGDNSRDWDWEKAVTIEHPHPLGVQKPLDKIFNVKTDAVEANEEAVNKLAFKLNGEGIYKVTSGPAMRIIMDFADVEGSVSVLPTGNSGNRFSRHYADQKELYTKGKYRPQLMNEETIKEKSENKIVLKPGN